MRIKQILSTAILAIACLGLVAGLIVFASRLKRDYHGLSIRISDTPISGKRLKRLMEQESGELVLTAAWSRKQAVALTAESFAASTQARPIVVSGDPRQICAMTLLSGGYLVEDDTGGCLITADVAMALFHSVDAVGLRVFAGATPYLVRGVVSAYEPMVITRNAEAAYENLEFAPTDLSGGAAQAEAFLYRHGLSGASITVQNGMFARILFGLAFLPAAIACLLSATAYVQAYARRRKTAASLLLLLPAAGSALLALMTLKHTFYWPQIYLPTRSSDFAFWGTLLTDWRATWKSMTLMTPLPKDVQFFQAARAVVCAALSALLLESALYRRVRVLLHAPSNQIGEHA